MRWGQRGGADYWFNIKKHLRWILIAEYKMKKVRMAVLVGDKGAVEARLMGSVLHSQSCT